MTKAGGKFLPAFFIYFFDNFIIKLYNSFKQKEQKENGKGISGLIFEFL